MTPLLIPTAIAWAVLIVSVLVMLRQSRINAGMHPRRGEGDQQGTGDVNAELDGGGLPTRVIDLNHNGSIYS